MYQFGPDAGGVEHDDHLDVSFRRPDGWRDLPPPSSTGGHIATLLLGDDVDGPFCVFGSTRPTDQDALRGPAHGHESDTWRITLLGSSPMGLESYGPGEFRYQIGARPYGADGYASGPDGGFHLVMFGDRRGFPTQPVKQEHAARYAAENARAAAAFGIDVPDVYPEHGRGIATTIGSLDKAGKVNGSFADAASWREVAPGVRASAGLLGHRIVGPVVLLVRADAGAPALPWASADTELLVLVVAGSCTIGGERYERGDARIQHAGAPFPGAVAGADGAAVCLVVADRSRAGDLLGSSPGTWAVTPADLVASLADALLPVG